MCFITGIFPLVLLQAQQTLGAFTFYPNSSSASIIAEVKIDGVSAQPSDVLAAFDSEGNCAGAVELIAGEDGLTYANLSIYGDETFTDDIDEGINIGESFSFQLFQTATQRSLEYKNSDGIIQFSDWSNLFGAFITSFKYKNHFILEFCSEGTKCLNNRGSNLTIQNILPVPATDYVSVQFSTNQNETVFYEIFNIIGKKIIERKMEAKQGNNTFRINLEDFTKGVYFIKINSLKNRSVATNFIKN